MCLGTHVLFSGVFCSFLSRLKFPGGKALVYPGHAARPQRPRFTQPHTDVALFDNLVRPIRNRSRLGQSRAEAGRTGKLKSLSSAPIYLPVANTHYYPLLGFIVLPGENSRESRERGLFSPFAGNALPVVSGSGVLIECKKRRMGISGPGESSRFLMQRWSSQGGNFARCVYPQLLGKGPARHEVLQVICLGTFCN